MLTALHHAIKHWAILRVVLVKLCSNTGNFHYLNLKIFVKHDFYSFDNESKQQCAFRSYLCKNMAFHLNH